VKEHGDDIARAYDLWADTYDTDPNGTRDLAGEVLRRAGLALTDRRVVEIGCGTGSNTSWLCERAREVQALDFSAGMLRHARARVRYHNVRFLQHDVRETWPLADGSADLVLILLVLEHVERLEPVFAEAARVLDGGGSLCVCELHPARQRAGKRAEFTHPDTGKRERIAAFLHDVDDYVNGGLGAGFRLDELRHCSDEGAAGPAPPRLLWVRFDRPPVHDA